MKKIVIDCRYLGMSGIGRVLEGYLLNLDTTNYEFYFIGNSHKLSLLGIKENVIEDNHSPVSKKGLFLPKEINQYDALFIPNFIVPFGVKIPVYTLIHDMMFYDFKETTSGIVDQLIKSFFYRRCIKKSVKIFTVSNFTKQRIQYYFPNYKKEIVIVYNGLSKSIVNYKNKRNVIIKKNYLIFVGNIKKQKGLATLLDAFLKLYDYELYIVGNKENFRTKDKVIEKYLNNRKIHFTGKISDKEMFDLISGAKFLIQPSYYEGFGLPPLEALFLNTKPIVSNIEVFKEIYSQLDVTFFEVGNVDSLLETINNSCYSPVSDVIPYKYNFKNSINIILKEIDES